MDFSALPYAARIAVGLAGISILYLLFNEFTVGRRRRSLQREKGTLPAPYYTGFRDRFLGLDLFVANMKHLKERRFLENAVLRFHHDKVNTMRVVSLGEQMHFTMEPENLKTIQAIDFKRWKLSSRRKFGFRPLLGEGIFTTDGPAWHHSRDMLRPNFVRSQIGDLATFEKHIAHLIEAVPRDSSTVDLAELFFRLTMDSATEFLFGESTESLSKGGNEGFAEAFTRSQEYIAHKSRWGLMTVLFPANKNWDQDRTFVHSFVDHYVDKGLAKRDVLLAQKSNAQRYIFIDELIRQTTDRVRIRSELLNVLLAGRDTTASLLTNVWFTLSQRPDLWTKLQAEIGGLNGEIPTFEQLKELKFLKALLNESLRLYPVVPVNSRQAQVDTTLPLGGGPDGSAPIFIKKGTGVAWSVYGMHRRKDYYGEDAEEFRPERWLDDPLTGKKGLRPGWEYLPFNGGARICLGQQFALTEASYTTARLCQAFDRIESRDSQPWTESLTLTCVNLGGAKVRLTARDT
ncbi:hypothetical protein LTR08_007549 [Meristemomyces frigidus]|nr:hypothetical protein LTR08_007549 [Meristemomyces frigidus]